MNGYEAVMAIAREDPTWLRAIRACLDYRSEEFAGRWILQGLDPRPPTLKPLLDAGVLVHSQEPSADGKTWFRISDRNG
ncbi:MAG: hypothetical protein ACTHNB_04840, partial [Gaiellaceae bacterium]